MNKQQHQLMLVMRKIGVFKGLEIEHIQRILRVAVSKQFDVGQRIYIIGKPSDEMLVLLRGRLLVTTASGDQLGEILPGSPTGEMGVLTNQPRSANISAMEPSVAVVITKKNLDAVLASNASMYMCIMKNIVELLCERMAATNQRNDALQRRISLLEGEDDYDGDDEGEFDNDSDYADESDEYPEE
ncbi:MAG: Crp/Fnr family transcriptional regulator [Candidatus Latescibacterota bacterium]|nr:Crp/Fnr family transcriptional regulator [Candidatus Latescibacterota bacterium]